jgi:cytochrome c553
MDLLPIETSLHAERTLRQHLKPHKNHPALNRCGPCHAAHASTTGSNTGMWSGPLGPDGYPQDMRYCLGCHGPDGPATKVHAIVHPTVPMRNTAEAPSPRFLPLIDGQGHLGHQGRMTCQTCHLPHGRAPSRDLSTIESAATESERQAMATMLRPYVAPNLCSGCHGFEGLRRFLYYHYPEKRTSEPGNDRKTVQPTSSPSSPTPAGPGR